MIEISHDAASRQARSSWASLTPTEANVAKLVAEGPSNPEIVANLLLSRRYHHVSHIWPEFGSRSRIGIVREPALRAAASR